MIHDYIVFCDFDGTVTNWETAEGLWSHLLGQLFHVKMAELVDRGANTSEGIKELFHLVPSSDYPLILEYIKNIEIRNGFMDFLIMLKKRNIPFVLVSGGIREMIDYGLLPYKHLITDIYCCDLDTSKKSISIHSDYDDGVDLLRKELVMQKYNYKHAIFLGDSYTDMNAALKADIVFARDRLENFMKEQGRDYFPFENFFDVIHCFSSNNYTNLL